jgi:purine-binding chemotaxis protein CheW
MSGRGAEAKRSDDNRHARSVVCRVGARICALPVEVVIETMRPLPIEPVAGVPAFVVGLAIIRGQPVPVVDAARLLGAVATEPTRFVTIRVRSRCIALAVDAVVGVRTIDAGALGQLPPLLAGVGRDVITAVGTLDAQLLLVLESTRVIPIDVWSALDRAMAERFPR